jgi:hypothetical protein
LRMNSVSVIFSRFFLYLIYHDFRKIYG